MAQWRRFGWELALAALLLIEILAFGVVNPRMLDINVLLFSTSDFICIGIVALPLTMVIVSGGIDISFGSTIGLCAIALRYCSGGPALAVGNCDNASLGCPMRFDQRRIDHLHRYQSFGDHPRHHVPVWR